MYTRVLIVILLASLVLGCGRGRKVVRPPLEDSDTSVDEIYNQRFALEGFQDRLGDAVGQRDADNPYLFRHTLDSLIVEINRYLRHNPDIQSDRQFARILNQVAVLDTLLEYDRLETEAGNPGKFTAEDDSLALSFADWPDLDIKLNNGLMFNEYDSDFPVESNKRIDFWIRYYTGKGKARFERSVYRMHLYRPIVEEILREKNLPKELICVALIESGFSMSARSYASAVGPWQFIKGTAKIYNLRVNWWYDERRDIVASTYAACNYLADLYGIWNDWYLALAGYNCGEYRVARQTARQGTRNFWNLRLPKQTQRYVPKFLAALYILRDPEKYGIEIPAYVEPFTYDEVVITDATEIKVIAECAGTTSKAIRDLNPACLRWATPPKQEITIKVPRGKGDVCAAKLAALPPEKRMTWRRHKIGNGETLSTIADKYGTSVSTLKRLNGIKNSHRIRAGKTLVVPVRPADATVASNKPNYKNTRRDLDAKKLEAYANRNAPPKGYKKIIYVVRRQDTLGHIAEAYNTSAQKIRSWNNLAYRRHIYPGQKLRLYLPTSFKAKSTSASTQVASTTTKPSTNSHILTTHVVRRGDTFYSISKRYGVPMSDVLAWNKKSPRSVIHPGDKVEIWKKKN